MCLPGPLPPDGAGEVRAAVCVNDTGRGPRFGLHGLEEVLARRRERE